MEAINGAIEEIILPLEVELCPIRAKAVSPGVIDMPWWDRVPPTKGALFQQAASATLVGRVGDPADVAMAIASLIQNAFITGTILEFDGGFRLVAGRTAVPYQRESLTGIESHEAPFPLINSARWPSPRYRSRGSPLGPSAPSR